MKQQQQQLQQPRKQQKMTSFSLSSILLISHLLCSYTIISATITTIPTSNDYLVRGLDNIEPAYKSFNGTMYAGLIPTIQYHDIFALNNNNDHKNTTENDIGKLMFWYFDTKEPLYDDTIVIWLNGGPGCSSLGGCLFENCPVTIPMHPAGFFGIDSDPNILQPNQYTWTSVTRMIYVEQPQGTGFSIGKYPKNELDLSIDFYNFLQNLYIIFNDLNLRTKKLYFFGESYAGMYVPSIAHYIYKQNKLITNAKDNNINIDNTYNFNQYIINLKGIGLGNGWMDAKIQGPAVIDYAYWHGMIDSLTSKALHNEWINCQNGNDAIKYGNTNTNINTKYKFHEFTIPDECGIMGAVLEAAGSNQVSWGLPNAYDVSTWDPYTMLDDPKGAMAKFYNNPDVQKALNVEPIGKFWIECMPGAGRRRRRRLSKKDHRRRLEEDINDNELPGKTLLEHDQPESVIPYVAELLDDADIRVLIYNGDRDMTTNSQGSEYLLDHMNWSGANGWSNITEYNRGLWLPRYDNKKVGGYMKQYKNLEFLVVINSGHLVPYNEPQTALELITRFLGNESFIDKVLPKFNIQTSNVENNKTSNSIVSNNNNNDNNNDDDVIENSYNEHYESIIHTNHNHTNKNSIYGIETALIAFIFFIFGFFISRKFPAKNKYRQGYDIIQSVAELN